MHWRLQGCRVRYAREWLYSSLWITPSFAPSFTPTFTPSFTAPPSPHPPFTTPHLLPPSLPLLLPLSYHFYSIFPTTFSLSFLTLFLPTTAPSLLPITAPKFTPNYSPKFTSNYGPKFTPNYIPKFTPNYILICTPNSRHKLILSPNSTPVYFRIYSQFLLRSAVTHPTIHTSKPYLTSMIESHSCNTQATQKKTFTMNKMLVEFKFLIDVYEMTPMNYFRNNSCTVFFLQHVKKRREEIEKR